uniref:Si:dkey-85k7.12 n=1 Tax=Neolamprologus brichardi TaxID=32507 RepID=A0A3Q4GG15_NEOBR
DKGTSRYFTELNYIVGFPLENLMKDLDIEQYYGEKLTLGRILEINEKTITDQPVKSNSDLPWCFLKKLMMVNVTARNVKSLCESDSDDESQDSNLDFDDLFKSPDADDMLNPLDIITALFLCSDGFLQQEIALKMSMCQFSVPLLLPNCDTNQCTLMLWAMRDIVKKYRPQSLSESKVFVFFDHLDLSKCSLLSNQKHKTKVCLVGNYESKRFSKDRLKEVATKLGLTKNIIIKTKSKNDADLVKDLRKTITDVVENSKIKMTIEQMAHIAHELGILVDEDSPECQTAKTNAEAITAEIQDILKYKDAQLPCQGEIWKKLTRLEKEEFRLRKVGSKNIEDYKSELKLQKKELRKNQNSYDMSTAMTCFIDAISSPGTKRFYFLKWMRMNLDNLSRTKMSELRMKYKEKCKNSKNKEEIKEIDRQISNSSLGIEHFFREMGQIYEASLSLRQTDPARQQLQNLPKLCAELLLDGFPLELVDGDASNIPLRWVSDVLSQLSDLVSPNRKILVVTVLGVQSTGKSTLLNTMFGVQFAVSSGRCTRGAFMLLIKINEDMKKVLNCDFMVIIDTEGLKSPELAQLDNSYEHDNELATLVIGLSDVTIVNVAMENSTEMKDILQIVVNQVGHQNVSDVSAHDNNSRDRKLLLEQLNEMTQAAAKMEKKEENKSFTDVMEYSPDTGNWYIPGLWNGNPPMAPVNAGYSEAVYELKKHIIQLLGSCESSANDISEFNEWMTSLWTAVKHENFIFSFRNSLVADAYMKLCTEFNKWEWEFKKEMYTWVTNAERRISNFGTTADKSGSSDMREFLTSLESDASTVLSRWETKLLENLTKYFKQTEGRVYLVEGYKEEFSNSAKCLRKEMERSVFNQLTAAAEIREGMAEIEKIKENHTKEIEKAVCALIDECRKKNIQMGETELENEFHKMWSDTLKKLSFFEQKTKNVFTSVSHYLRINLSHKGSHVCELLSQKSLQDCGKEPFKYTSENFYHRATHTMSRLAKLFNIQDHIMAVQKQADSIIDACTQFVREKVKKKSNYSETYIQEILHMIDEKLQNNKDVNNDTEFKVSLKQHICGFAAREFQKMHEDFIQENDPYRCLMKNKEKFRDDFIDVYHERDQCQKKAEEFTNQCLKPAVEDSVSQSLGPDITGEMLTCEQFSNRMSFQYSVLLDLLSKDDFENYVSYTDSYEYYVKMWIHKQIVEHFSTVSTMSEFEGRRIQSCIRSINDAINKAKTGKSDDLKTFVEDICKELGDKLVISQDALGAFMILNNADKEQFAHWLTVSVNNMAKDLRTEFQTLNFEMKLKHLKMNPQNELFNKLVGCGKQCPFCKAPCDAGGGAHTEHFASLHRPKGLGNYRWHTTKKLVTEICSSPVISDNRFRCNATNNEWHPYKHYKEIFPDWKIPPDASLEAADYWKFIMAKYNNHFAKKCNAIPADIPSAWKQITRDQAEKSLKESFHNK